MSIVYDKILGQLREGDSGGSSVSLSNDTPSALQSNANAGSSAKVARADHVHSTEGLVTTAMIGQKGGVPGLDNVYGHIDAKNLALATYEATDVPKALSATANKGTSYHIARADHVHPTTGLVLSSEKGVAGGVATLDGMGQVPESQLPTLGCTSEEAYYYSLIF